MNDRRVSPSAGTFTSAPLRNRLQVQLNAPENEVWALVGDLARLPEYSAGLERVDVAKKSDGTPAGYVCHFKPYPGTAEGMAHQEVIRWYEVNRGFASSGTEGNPFGLIDDLNLVTVAQGPGGTLLTWEVYFDAGDVPAMRSSYDNALADIGSQLVARFGGRLVEVYTEP
ncbi:MAG TPA: SRPBCC family protein [Vicinamibacterales bacterium]|nr:SRPBCC family protein [Vicinamibacterales bacterium]